MASKTVGQLGSRTSTPASEDRGFQTALNRVEPKQVEARMIAMSPGLAKQMKTSPKRRSAEAPKRRNADADWHRAILT
jgi:hypothetical protein